MLTKYCFKNFHKILNKGRKVLGHLSSLDKICSKKTDQNIQIWFRHIFDHSVHCMYRKCQLLLPTLYEIGLESLHCV